ncbi:hypothetical protein [Yoonia sp. 208BN28-4]|uniref:hypothetical protein n=1 Tax=Yoonia sp. 208BN28-4 TaxID=3126505 RepID=UPI0030AE6E37
MRIILAAIALAALPMAAAAQSALDRYEAASELLQANTYNFFESRVPGLAAVRPSTDWTAADRQAGACLIEGLRAAKGDAGVATYLSDLEAFARQPITSIAAMSANTPASLADAQTVQIGSSCGTDKIGQAQMQRSGLVAQLSNPVVLSRIMAQ